MDRNNELAGKVAIVTGSARNIGRAVALELARAGAAVTVNARSDGEAAAQVVEEIRSAGGQANCELADITLAQDVNRLVDRTVQAFGRVDVLVNNAAVRSTKAFTELRFEDWEQLRAVACDGALRMSLAVVPHMTKAGGGSIVGIHGMGSYLAMPGGAHKSAVKDAMAGMHRGMARDLGHLGIRANIAVVGSFETDRASGSGAAVSQTKDASVPIGRKGVAQEMANLVRFLVGPFSGYISGQTVHVNGGAHMPH
jgi:3-oxoacyl-[acyl-carrier protein] reductase